MGVSKTLGVYSNSYGTRVSDVIECSDCTHASEETLGGRDKGQARGYGNAGSLFRKHVPAVRSKGDNSRLSSDSQYRRASEEAVICSLQS